MTDRMRVVRKLLEDVLAVVVENMRANDVERAT